jgi:ribosome maturation factor RimP
MTSATAMPTIQQDIEAALSGAEPAVEVLLAEVSGNTVRLYIDHPDGVSLALCERVTHQLPEVRERYALEVSSPGPDRPLAKPEHFRRFVGSRARLRLRAPHDGHKQYTGELVGATGEAVTLATPDGIVSVAYDDIARANLVPGE